MVTKEFVDYVQGQLASGFSKEDIIQKVLEGSDWERAEVEEAFAAVEANRAHAEALSAMPPPVPRSEPRQTTPPAEPQLSPQDRLNLQQKPQFGSQPAAPAQPQTQSQPQFRPQPLNLRPNPPAATPQATTPAPAAAPNPPAAQIVPQESTEQTQAQTPEETTKPPKLPPNRNIPIAITGILLLAALGAGGYLLYPFLMPQDALAAALQKINNANSYMERVTMTVTEPGIMTMQMNGTTTVDVAHNKSMTHMTAKMLLSKEQTSAFPPGLADSLTVTMDMMDIDSTAYVKMTTDNPTMAMFIPLPKDWLKITATSTSSQLSGQYVAIQDQNKVQDLLSFFRSGKNPVTVESKEDETLPDGTKAAHYHLTFTPEFLKTLDASEQNFFTQVATSGVDMWVGKDTKDLKKISFGGAYLTITTSIISTNQPVDIQPPTDAISLTTWEDQTQHQTFAAGSSTPTIVSSTHGQGNPVSDRNVKHYSNDFYRFDFPDTYTISKETVYNTHQKIRNKDLFGTSFVNFAGTMGQKPTVSSFPRGTTTPVEEIASLKNNFEKEYHNTPADVFEEIHAGDLSGSLMMLPSYDNGISSRIGSLQVDIFSKSYWYELKINWAPTEQVSAEEYQKDAENFANLFIKTFKEKSAQ